VWVIKDSLRNIQQTGEFCWSSGVYVAGTANRTPVALRLAALLKLTNFEWQKTRKTRRGKIMYLLPFVAESLVAMECKLS